MQIRKILVPVDFSPSSRLAVEHAFLLAERFGATVHLLHAWEVPTYLRPDLTVWAGDVSATLADHARSEADKAMKEFLGDTKASERAGVTHEVRAGSPFATILSAVETGGYDLVAMGTHGRSGIPHLVLGSVAERVVRHAPCPVLTVRDPHR